MKEKLSIEHIQLNVNSSKIHCIKAGRGKELLLAFHGYGERCSMFLPVANKLPERYTLYAIDLPIHGESEWKGKKIKGEIFVDIVQQILKKEKANRCSLMGFSLGGRIALYLTEKIPYLIHNIYLIAPDGIVTSSIYRNVQRVPDICKRVSFKLLVNKYSLKLAKRLHKRGWLNHHNYRFTEVHFATAKKRRRLLIYWMALDGFDPNWKKTQKLIKEHQIKMKIFLGTHDEVIPSSAGRILTEGLDNAEIVFLNSNHRMMNRVFFKRVENLL